MYKLILKPTGMEPVEIKMQRYEKDLLSHDNMNVANVYADRDYDIQLVEMYDGSQPESQKISVAECEQSDLLTYKISHEDKGFKRTIRNFSVYVNEDKLDTYGSPDNIVVVNKKIFADSFGFARITLEIQYADGAVESYFSDYVSIMLNDIDTVNRINNMYEYIFENEKDLLFKQNAIDTMNEKTSQESQNKSMTSNRSQKSAAERSKNEDSVLVKLVIAEDLARLYENNFGYFRTNSRYKIRERYVVDDVEKLRSISSKTLDYIASHPEQLSPAAGNAGIKINGQGYFPKKTLIQENEISVDIYENQVLVGFLYRIIADLSEIKSKLENLERNTPLMDNMSKVKNIDLEAGKYIHSAQFILSKTGNLVAEKKENVCKLLDKFQGLLNMYNSVLNVTRIDIKTVPKPTAIFMSVPNYNVMFNGICRWFNTAEILASNSNNQNRDAEMTVDANDAFMLSFVNLSSLFELYALCQLIDRIKASGYELEYSEKYSYRMDKNSYYVNSECVNTFVFSNDKEEHLTLYYQPVIYKGGHRNNRTGLYRNISLSFSENGYRGEYYVPDYVIKKVGKDGINHYSVLDAKFMSKKNVIYKIPELSYKYLFSLATVSPNDCIDALYILYGKPDITDNVESAYDYEMEQDSIRPRVQMIPLG